MFRTAGNVYTTNMTLFDIINVSLFPDARSSSGYSGMNDAEKRMGFGRDGWKHLLYFSINCYFANSFAKTCDVTHVFEKGVEVERIIIC